MLIGRDEPSRARIMSMALPGSTGFRLPSNVNQFLEAEENRKYRAMVEGAYKPLGGRNPKDTSDSADDDGKGRGKAHEYGQTIPESVSPTLHRHTCQHQLDIYNQQKRAPHKAIAYHIWGPTGAIWGCHFNGQCAYILSPLEGSVTRPSMHARTHQLLSINETAFNLLVKEVKKLDPDNGKTALPPALVDICGPLLYDLTAHYILKTSTARTLGNIVLLLSSVPGEWDACEKADPLSAVTSLLDKDKWKLYNGTERSMMVVVEADLEPMETPKIRPAPKKCNNCQGNGHFGYECKKPCKRPQCAGKEAHTGTSCPLRKVK